MTKIRRGVKMSLKRPSGTPIRRQMSPSQRAGKGTPLKHHGPTHGRSGTPKSRTTVPVPVQPPLPPQPSTPQAPPLGVMPVGIPSPVNLQAPPLPSEEIVNKLKVSVVIPTYNRAEMLYRTLWSIWRHQPKNYEVLVSNDDDPEQSERTEKIVQGFVEAGMPVKSYYTGQYKRGQGWSVETYPYNVGIRNATGGIIILNSGDVMSVTDIVSQHRAYHTASENRVIFSTVHALTMAVQKNIETYDWKKNPNTLLFKGSCYKMFTGVGLSYTTAYTVEDAGAPYHFQMSVKKKHLWDIRGFDEDYYGAMTCGDDDLADRLRRKGLTFHFVPDIVAIHQCHASPEYITKRGCAEVNRNVESGHTLFHGIRKHQNIIRNANHDWGEYPRNMDSLPVMSGAV